MNAANLIHIALRALSSNKMRCLLTMLGIIIGVSSVITMMFLGESQKQSIRSEISGMGTNLIIIQPAWERGGVRASAADLQRLRVADFEALRNQSSYLGAVSPVVSTSGQAIMGANNTPASITGCVAQQLEIENYTIDDGAMWGEAEVRSAAKVCVIGSEICRKLFPDGSSPWGRPYASARSPSRSWARSRRRAATTTSASSCPTPPCSGAWPAYAT